MNAHPGVLRRTYDYVAMFALLHVLAAVGVGAYFIGSGMITPKKLQGIAAVMREEGDVTEQEDSEPEQEGVEPGPSGSGLITNSQLVVEQSELLRFEAERIKAELDQRLTLNNNIMLRVTTKRDEFQREQDRVRQRARVSQERRQEKGFRKQIAIFEALSPKVAVEHLLNLESPDEAAGVLLEMNTRKAKKIVESAKTGAQLQQMQTILQRLRDVAPDRSNEFDKDAGNP